MLKIGIIDYGVGNLGSVLNAFNYLQSDSHLPPFSVQVESSARKLKDYDKLLLPGVGAFQRAMEHLRTKELESSIKDFAKSGKYMLGICLGMQLLFDKSYEFGECAGLGLLSGEVREFNNIAPLKVPHIGWNSCSLQSENALLAGIKDKSFFYFVHSFHISASLPCVIGTCHYGYDFGAIVRQENLLGIQAHPEKSHNIGLQFLANFVKLA